MYRIHSPDLAHVRLDCFDFTVARDHTLPGAWVIKPVWDDDPGLDLGVFLAIRQARHHGYTVWTTTRPYRRISYCDYPIDACDEFLRFGLPSPPARLIVPRGTRSALPIPAVPRGRFGAAWPAASAGR